MVSVVIIGASGHGKVIADIVEARGDVVAGYLDDDTGLGDEFNGYPILGVARDYVSCDADCFIIAIGNAAIREGMAAKMSGVSWYTAIHPTAVVSGRARIGEGSAVMPLAVVNADAVVGAHCIINSSAVVEHDDRIDDFAHVSVGAHIAGTVRIGARTWIGIGASVSNNLNICADCMIGAGAVVIDDIDIPGTYVGVPAVRIEE